MKNIEKIGMNKAQKYYLGQGPWYIIKEYLGIYSGYRYKEFMDLELEVIQNIWYNKVGQTIGAWAPSPSRQPTPYQHQKYKWRKIAPGSTQKPPQGLIYEYHLELGRIRRHNPVKASRPDVEWNHSPREWLDELSEEYYKQNFPELVATLDAMNSVLEKDRHLKTVTNSIYSIIRPINAAALPHQLRRELDADVTGNITEAAVEAHSSYSSFLKSKILAACVNDHRRHDVYKALDRCVRQKYRLCVCGCTVPTKGKAFENHLKSINHCEKVLKNSSVWSLEAWYCYTNTVPPGFVRKSVGTWSHIIPEDRKRTYRHVIRHQNSVDLASHLKSDPDASGHFNPYNIVVI